MQRAGGALSNGTYVLVRVYLTSPTHGDHLCTMDSESSTQFSNSTLNSSSSQTQTVQCVPPAGMPVGSDYQWRVVVDPTNFHAESDETDNTSTASGSVVVQ